MKLANRGEADIKKSLSQDAAFLCKKISLNPMFRCMRSLCKDLDFSVIEQQSIDEDKAFRVNLWLLLGTL